MTETTPSPLGNVITIDDERIKSYLDRVVRGSVELPAARAARQAFPVSIASPWPACGTGHIQH